jgi:hypothetical protein
LAEPHLLTAVDWQRGHSGAAAKLTSIAAIEGAVRGDAAGAAAVAGDRADAPVICA